MVNIFAINLGSICLNFFFFNYDHPTKTLDQLSLEI